MQPRINVITLAVRDLERSLAFYRDGLGLPTDGVVGTEFPGDETQPAGALVMINLDEDLLLALYPSTELAKDANIAPADPGAGDFSLGHFVNSREEVDDLLAMAARAGATLTEPAHNRPWGIYSGYFRDPDGHLWEVIFNPGPDVAPTA